MSLEFVFLFYFPHFVIFVIFAAGFENAYKSYDYQIQSIYSLLYD